MKALNFRKVSLPGDADTFVPSTISIAVPATLTVERDRLHLLTHIPWSSAYLKHVPGEYRAFFRYVLPYLSPRTTSVHTALSVAFIPVLVAGIDPSANVRIITLAVILHDCGWSQVSPSQIADSLDYSGIMFTPKAAEAKRLHAVHGSRIAYELLRNYEFKEPLTEAEINLIADIALYHEQPLAYNTGGKTPNELIITCEADRLWPFTHENFWLDVIRKGVAPSTYIQNAAASIEGLFLTETGRHIAWRLMNERITEVAAYESFIARSNVLRHTSLAKFA